MINVVLLEIDIYVNRSFEGLIMKVRSFELKQRIFIRKFRVYMFNAPARIRKILRYNFDNEVTTIEKLLESEFLNNYQINFDGL